MKIPTLALLLCVATLAARADDTTAEKPADKGTALVPNNHGGYNVYLPSARGKGGLKSGALFGHGGFASYQYQHRNDPQAFILVPTVQDRNGQKVTVYKKVYFNTPEEAAQARASMHY